MHPSRYFVYQNTSNNALPFQSWSSVIPCPHMKNRMKIVFVGLYSIIFLLARLQAESERAAINQLIFAANLCRRCHNSHEAGRVDGASCMRSRTQTFSEESKALSGKKQQTSVVPNGFIQRVSPIKPSRRTLSVFNPALEN